MTPSTSPTKARQAQAASSSKDSQPLLQPLHCNPSPASQATQHIHVVLLAALFILAFDGLVADPVSSMRSTLLVVMALQAAYAFVCLPVAGSQSSKASRKPRPGEKKTGADGTGSNVIVVGAPCQPIHPR